MQTPADNSDLPKLYREIANVTDRATALRIAQHVGGTRRFVSGRMTADNWLVRLVGKNHAAAILKHCIAQCGNEFEFPMGPERTHARGRTADRMILSTTKSNNAIASDVGLHFKTVQRRRKKLREAGIL